MTSMMHRKGQRATNSAQRHRAAAEPSQRHSQDFAIGGSDGVWRGAGGEGVAHLFFNTKGLYRLSEAGEGFARKFTPPV
jgi:hypothetical protein